jgi:hypothetical protein
VEEYSFTIIIINYLIRQRMGFCLMAVVLKEQDAKIHISHKILQHAQTKHKTQTIKDTLHTNE